MSPGRRAHSRDRRSVAAVVGFPLGNTTTAMKQLEALECEKEGATELDVVINIGALKAGDARYVEREIDLVMRRTPECAHKVIIETGMLDAPEVLGAVRIVNALRPAFIKTCTGFGPRGVTVADVDLIRSELADGILVKASAGIKDLASATALVGAGASVLGTSSTLRILEELESLQRAASR
ncbi:MAG: deoxyribose-phosphate aldolase [Acidobacteriota bacterium]